MKERWKWVEGYEGFYKISSIGRLKCPAKKIKGRKNLNNVHVTVTRNKKYRKLKPNKRGYITITLYKNGLKKSISVHRLVALAFLPMVDGKNYINHKNGIKSDNRVENLEWCTCKENIHHALDTGLKRTGEIEGFTKLKNKEVLEIRAIYARGESTYRKLALRYNVTPRNIACIIKRITWKRI